MVGRAAIEGGGLARGVWGRRGVSFDVGSGRGVRGRGGVSFDVGSGGPKCGELVGKERFRHLFVFDFDVSHTFCSGDCCHAGGCPTITRRAGSKTFIFRMESMQNMVG